MPTACASWDVEGVALHLLGGEISNLSRRRDGVESAPAPGEDLVAWLNARNEEWVRAARGIGHRLLIELLDFTGEAFERHLATLDLDVRSGHVSWVGDDPVPSWLDVARELTERWVHQQQIRDATGRPGAMDAELTAAVLGTFVHALPRTYRAVEGEPGTAVELRVEGPGGGTWHVLRSASEWSLGEGAHPSPTGVVTLDVDAAWRLFTRNPERRPPRIEGDEALANVMGSAIAIVG